MRRPIVLFALVLSMGCSSSSSNGSVRPDSGVGSSGGSSAETGGGASSGGAISGAGGASRSGGAGGSLTGGAASLGTGGSATGGLTGSGGATSNGSGGTSTGTGGSLFNPADRCSPGQYYPDPWFGGAAIECGQAQHDAALANGIGASPDGFVGITSLKLPSPMQPGHTTALSKDFEILGGSGPTPDQIEFWAAMSECGTTGTLEKFYTHPIDTTGVYCGSIDPTDAYPYLLMVVRPIPDSTATDGSVERGVTLCMEGTCPGP